MPSLVDTLNALSEHSAQIHQSAQQNRLPAGPFTTALLDSLHLNPSSSSSSFPPYGREDGPKRRKSLADKGVLSLIRDAHESEVRLFKFIGESETAGLGRIKKVEKREGVVTPLKSLQGQGGQGKRGAGERDEVDIMLRTALRLVDDYRPMPRARQTITSLLETHHSQTERIFELERQIEEASSSVTGGSTASVNTAGSQPAASSGSGKAKESLSADEAIKAEENALRVLERKLAPLRRARNPSGTSAPSSRDPSPEKAPVDDDEEANDSRVPAGGRNLAHSHRTPAKQSVSDVPITNALVSGTTPRHPRTTPGRSGFEMDRLDNRIDRFSPLKFLGTPRANARLSSRTTLREVMGSPVGAREEVVGKGIFERRVTSGGSETPRAVVLSAYEKPTDSVDDETPEVRGNKGIDDEGVDAGEDQGTRNEGDDDDQTVRYGASEASVTADGAEETANETELPQEAVENKDRTIEGVRDDLPAVAQAVSKIWETLPEVMRQGLSDDQELPQTATATISHLARIARSDPAPPPSPSSHSTSTLSSGPATSSTAKAPPITPQTILTAHLLLILLRSATHENNEAAESMNELKDQLSAIARARGWETVDPVTGAGAGGMGTKCVYHVVGKRVVKIERRWPNGGKVQFAI